MGLLTIDPMSYKDAEDLLCKRIGAREDMKGVPEQAAALDIMPLALV